MLDTVTSGIYVGFWTNWSKGQFFGTTLTLSSRNGALLIAFVALFVSWCGNQLWGLLTYSAYQVYVTDKPRPAFYRQFGLLLRSGIAAPNLLWRLFQLCWSWKGKCRTSNPSKAGLPPIILATLHITIVTLAGIFSSRLTATTSEALQLSTSCGFHNLSIMDIQDIDSGHLDSASAVHVASAIAFDYSRRYVRSCYDPTGVSSTPTGDCFKYVYRQRIERSEKCTFAPGACASGSISADSGYLDTDADLGINAPKNDRIQFRKVMQCSVIEAEKEYSSEWTESTALPAIYPFPTDPILGAPGASYKLFNLGPNVSRQVQRPFTFIVANYSVVRRPYNTLVYSTSERGRGYMGFDPVPDLATKNAETTIWILQNGVSYVGPVTDPWYKSTTKTALGKSTVWVSDYAATALGCTERFQLCNGARCSELTTLAKLDASVVSLLQLNPRQVATYSLVWKLMAIARMQYIISNMQDTLLLARDHSLGESMLSTQLPDTQWELEAQMIFNMSLSLMAIVSSFHANMPDIQITPNKTLRQYVIPENTKEALNLCQNQKTTTQAFNSFSVVGLIFIFGTGLVIIICADVVPRLVTRRRSPLKVHGNELDRVREDGWRKDDILVLDSIALKAYQPDSWELTSGVPLPINPDKVIVVPWIHETNRLTKRSRNLSCDAWGVK